MVLCVIATICALVIGKTGVQAGWGGGGIGNDMTLVK